jgi:nucleotide-binding universal stress UspA family protein
MHQSSTPKQPASTKEQSMTPFKKILVAVDFSDDSRAALDLAVEMARDNSAALHLLHCYQIQPGGISPYGIALPSEYFTELREAATGKLNDWQKEFVPAELESDARVDSEHPSLAITIAAERTGADLIVMGTRGLTGFKHVLLGSTAERIVRTAPCPVMTVKADASN